MAQHDSFSLPLTRYGQLYVLFLRHHSRTSNSTGAEVVLYHLPRYVCLTLSSLSASK